MRKLKKKQTKCDKESAGKCFESDFFARSRHCSKCVRGSVIAYKLSDFYDILRRAIADTSLSEAEYV